MYLLVNTLSHPALYILFDSDRVEQDRFEVELRGKESEQFFLTLEKFLGMNRLGFQNLSGMIVINGPWGFTSMRIVTLVSNTIAFAYRTLLYPLDLFSFLSFCGNSFPMILRANRWECLIKRSEAEEAQIMAVSEIPSGTYSGIANDFENPLISVQFTPDYGTFLKNFIFPEPEGRVAPIYVKKPNISTKKPDKR